MGKKQIQELKVGVLGGGQLGKMMGIAALNWHLPLHFLDQSRQFPAGLIGSCFTEGQFKNFEDVYEFGKEMDVVTIEIEHVNTEALKQLKSEGIAVHPDPEMLEIIKDKGLQKQFYQKHQLPTAPFTLYENGKAITTAIESGKLQFPFVQKSRTAGYDGKGVAVLQSEADLPKLMDTPSVIEEKIKIAKELAVVVARNENGEIKAFPTVEMVFNPVANLVEFLNCPADIEPQTDLEAQQLAFATMEAFQISGLLAVELFLTETGQILINEVAPRPHNSGHHTIDSCYTSQFEQHLRGILNLPLGDTTLHSAGVMINLLGAEGFRGPVIYEGLSSCMQIEGAHFHLYGKEITKPFRKMGHATVTGKTVQEAQEKAKLIQQRLRIKSIN